MKWKNSLEFHKKNNKVKKYKSNYFPIKHSTEVLCKEIERNYINRRNTMLNLKKKVEEYRSLL